MSFKDKLFNLIYIVHKSNSLKEAITIIKGYRAIIKNNLFDKEFYLENYPKTSGMDPILHYIFFGFREGKKPSNEFDGIFYKTHYGDVNINPLIHYSLYGISENRKIKVTNRDLSRYNDENKISILFVLHEKIGTVGGTGFLNSDIVKNLPDEFNAFILTSDSQDIELWNFNGKLEKIANYPIGFNTDFSKIDNDYNFFESYDLENRLFNDDLAVIYSQILSKLDIKMVHINHLINHSFDLIDVIDKNSIPYLVNLHDFYYICPSIHLVNGNCQFCSFECGNCDGIAVKNNLNTEKVINTWRKLCFNILKNSYLNIAPTKSVVEFYAKFYPSLNNFHQIEHGVDIFKSDYVAKLTSNPIKILVPGHISPHKGSLLIRKIKQLDKNNKLEFHFIGTTIPDMDDFGVGHGAYDKNDFNNLVSKIKPSFSLILSSCPETYSYTLTESWMAGLPVIASDLGALKERISKTSGGWLVNYNNVQNVYNFILNINQNDYMNKISDVSKIHFKSLKEMSDEYNELYYKLADLNG